MSVNDELFFFVFGIDINNSSRDVKNKKCVEKAYLDMCRTLRYNSKCKNEKLDFKKRAYELIIESIGRYFNINNDERKVFDDWHKELSDSIIRIAKEYNGLFDKSITYGHTQKWINMSIKYMRLMGLLDEDRIKDVDIPIDSYIIEALKSNDVIFDAYDVKGLGIETDIKTWSQIYIYEEYRGLQNMIKQECKERKILPIEWESKAWIAMAMKKANTEA